MKKNNEIDENKKGNNKKKLYLTIGLSLLLIGILGYFIYNKFINNYNEYFNVITLSNEVEKITNLESRLENATFLNNQTEETVYKGPTKYKHTIKIVNNKVVIITENGKLKINSIKNPVSVSLISNNSYTEDYGNAYVLNDEGKIYSISYSTDKSKDALQDTMYLYINEYELPKVESYTINASLLGNVDFPDIAFFVIAKTYEGKYYTDFFDKIGTNQTDSLNKIVSSRFFISGKLVLKKTITYTKLHYIILYVV